ncbi:Uncharacterized protein Adt_33454 [Abeliophyllum distichum]|uniref:Retrotransposon gag domain-containing protein n=1 Tax=Abeliophyllum distichum TaxID=126358 RepID=A0ABD1QY98_9LAMI
MAPRGRRVNNGEQCQQPQPNGVDPHFAQQFLAMMHTFVQATAPPQPPLQPTPPALPPQPQAPTTTGDTCINVAVIVELFRKQHPPTFEGSIDPLEAEDWLVGIERIFDLIDCPDKKKKEAEFLTLTQGSISLTEYECKFEDLSHYVPTFVDTEEKKARCFEQGLRDDLRQAVVVLELGTYHEVLAKAQLADFKGRFSGEGKQQQSLVEKRKWEDNKGKEKQDYAKKGRVGPT